VIAERDRNSRLLQHSISILILFVLVSKTIMSSNNPLTLDSDDVCFFVFAVVKFIFESNTFLLLTRVGC
jgi:hypothetical protein